eukprot:GEZU01020752.1.p1 GENE.GEZU01020752.1~~GEZU01020752.1.p1  ORF type:complete len:320 (-),score=110.92 GEZU01020752.1:56-1015(-)
MPRQKILMGYPPKEISVDPNTSEDEITLAQLNIKNGESLQIMEQEERTTSKTQAPPSQQQQQQAPTAAAQAAEITDGIAAANAKNEQLLKSGLIPMRPTNPPAPISDAFYDWNMVRRVIPSDNSCMFNAVSYVLEGCSSRTKKDRAKYLRQVIANVIAGDEFTYNEAFLGKSNKEYCKWITDSDHWGGAIDLSILAEFYGVEIVALDIQTKRMDRYAEDKNFPQRVFLLYDGIHYDAIALAPPFEGVGEEIDLTIFSSSDEVAVQKAKKLVEDAHKKHEFTDLAGFTLRCLICGDGITGEKHAREHAKKTGHTNFAEYK